MDKRKNEGRKKEEGATATEGKVGEVGEGGREVPRAEPRDPAHKRGVQR